MREFRAAFAQSERLHRHIAFLYRQGSLCRVENGNLLCHGCVPMTEDGALAHAPFAGEDCAGPAMMRHHEQLVRRAYFQRDPAAVDFMWYLGTAERSPLCGRRLRTFERPVFCSTPMDGGRSPTPTTATVKRRRAVRACLAPSA